MQVKASVCVLQFFCKLICKLVGFQLVLEAGSYYVTGFEVFECFRQV